MSMRSAEDAVFCLGDVVGYGPKPRECLHRLMESGVTVLQGNHDREAVDIYRGRATKANQHMLWTVEQLHPEDIDLLEQLPRSLLLEGEWGACHLEHGDGTSRIYPDTDDAPLSGYYPVDDVDVIVYGHSHWAGVRRIGDTLLISPGSVSYPRDGIPWPGYLVWCEGKWILNRIDYDVERLIDMLREVGLSGEALERWSLRFRTGRDV